MDLHKFFDGVRVCKPVLDTRFIYQGKQFPASTVPCVVRVTYT